MLGLARLPVSGDLNTQDSQSPSLLTPITSHHIDGSVHVNRNEGMFQIGNETVSGWNIVHCAKRIGRETRLFLTRCSVTLCLGLKCNNPIV
jgi:hypothetical protein